MSAEVEEKTFLIKDRAQGRLLIGDPGHDRARSMGWACIWFLTKFARYGKEGKLAGKTLQEVPMEKDWQQGIVDALAVKPDGDLLYTLWVLNRMKGLGKSELEAWLALWFAFGPAEFSHFAGARGDSYTFLGETYTYSPGEPVGKPFEKPVIDLYATSQAQAQTNTFSYLKDELYIPKQAEQTEEWLANRSKFHQLKWKYQAVGAERITFPTVGKLGGEGTITSKTTNGAGSDGARTTFLALDEVHIWTSTSDKKTYSVTKKNLTKLGGFAMVTTTMHETGEGSVGEDLWKEAQAKVKQAEAGVHIATGTLYDYRYAPVTNDDLIITDENGLLDKKRIQNLEDKVRKYAAAGRTWVRTAAMVQDNLMTASPDISGFLRFWCNQPAQRASSAIHDSWILRASHRIDDYGNRHDVRPLEPGDDIVMAFDYSAGNMRSKAEGAVRTIGAMWKPDATALGAIRLPSEEEPGGSIHSLGIWEATEREMATGQGWQPPNALIDAAVRGAFEKYNVKAFYADPSKLAETQMLNAWHQAYKDRLAVWGSVEHSIALPPNGKRWNDIMAAYTDLVEGLRDGTLLLYPDEKLVEHLLNVRAVAAGRDTTREPVAGMGPRQLVKFMKHTGDESSRKIDAAVVAAYGILAMTDLRTKKNRKIAEEPAGYTFGVWSF